MQLTGFTYATALDLNMGYYTIRMLRGGDGNMDVGDVVYTRMTMLYDVEGR